MVLKVGSKGDDVKKLQGGLNSLGYACGTADGAFGAKTEDAVEAFQEACDLYGDGIAGPDTIKAFNAKVAPEFRIGAAAAPSTAPAVVEAKTKLSLVSVPCEKMGHGGYTSMKMREDVAEKYKALHAEALSLGGGVTTAGCLRPLSSGGGAAQSATSLHYCAIAWDLSLDSGMQKTTDCYLVENLGDRKWRVWMKSVGVSASAVPSITVNATICSTVNGKTVLTVKQVTGQYVDFTALAAKHGFFPIRGRKSFYTGGSYSGAEWWHFQCESVLTPGVSTFGGELLKIYDEATVKSTFRGDWAASKGATWKENWF
jgi:hypothetical protein